MKKIFKKLCAIILVASTLLPSALVGCAERENDGHLKILCTIFPIYDWARSVVGETSEAEVSLLVKNGADLHSYQPSFADMAAIRDSDVVIYVGGESDKWIEESIDNDTVAIKLSELDGITLYEVSADSIAQGHSHEDGEDCHELHDHSKGFDEHLWLSVSNAVTACGAILDVISELDEKNSETYSENTQTYINSLSSLDTRMTEISGFITEPLIFADRFPFVYLFEDYGIDYYAAFEGCTTDTDANFDTVVSLAQKLSKSKYSYVFVTETPSDELTDSVIRQSGVSATAVKLNSMQSLIEKETEGVSYIEIMDKNISVLEQIFT